MTKNKKKNNKKRSHEESTSTSTSAFKKLEKVEKVTNEDDEEKMEANSKPKKQMNRQKNDNHKPTKVNYEPDLEKDDNPNNNHDTHKTMNHEQDISDDDSSDYSSDEDDDGRVDLHGGTDKQISKYKHGVYDDEDNDDEDVSSEEEDEDDGKDNDEKKHPTKKMKTSNDIMQKSQTKSKQTKSTKKKNEEDIINVDFLFRDMDECFFHGLKTLLTSSNPIHAKHSSELTDLMIENISVGTIVSNEDECVFGFASVLPFTCDPIDSTLSGGTGNNTTNSNKNRTMPSSSSSSSSSSCIHYVKTKCQEHCPSEHLSDMKTVLSGTTKRPAGLFIHGRMINLPLEITLVLHQQLVMDMDWAVENAEGGEEERKRLNFGAFVILAPCIMEHSDSTHKSSSLSSLIFKHFEDEIFASHAEFTFSFDTPKTFATEERQVCMVIVITKTGHREAMKELKRMVAG